LFDHPRQKRIALRRHPRCQLGQKFIAMRRLFDQPSHP
jgi:hypothetical protein